MAIEQLTPLQPVVDDKRQTRRYYKRKRLKSLISPTWNLDPVHRFTAADNPINTQAFFPTRSDTQVFEIWLKATSLAANGILWEFGNADKGVALAIDGQDLIMAAGDGNVADPNGGCSSTVQAVILGLNKVYKVVVAVLPGGPGGGSMNMWVNGQIAGACQSVDTDFPGTNLANANGGVGAPAGAVIDRIPAPQAVALTNCEIVSQLYAFEQGQYPRQYRNGLTLGTSDGAGNYTNTWNSQVGG